MSTLRPPNSTRTLGRERKVGAGKGGNQLWEDEHFAWKGSEASTKAKHNRIRRRRGPASSHSCVRHLEYGIDIPARYWARIHTETGDDPWADYVALCAKCHEAYDYDEKRPPATVRQVCTQGHEQTPETAWYYKRGNGRTRVICKICKAIDPCQNYSGRDLPEWALDIVRKEVT